MTQNTENERTNRTEEYQYTDISIPIDKKRKEIITVYIGKDQKKQIYIPIQWVPTFNALRNILKREGSTLSRWIRQQADVYVRLHDPGNPQQLLTKVILEGKPYRAEACFICGDAAVHQIKHKNLVRYACPLHRAQALESGKWSDVKEG